MTETPWSTQAHPSFEAHHALCPGRPPCSLPADSYRSHPDGACRKAQQTSQDRGQTGKDHLSSLERGREQQGWSPLSLTPFEEQLLGCEHRAAEFHWRRASTSSGRAPTQESPLHSKHMGNKGHGVEVWAQGDLQTCSEDQWSGVGWGGAEVVQCTTRSGASVSGCSWWSACHLQGGGRAAGSRQLPRYGFRIPTQAQNPCPLASQTPPGRSPSPPLSSLTGNPPEETLCGSGPRAINPWCSGGISQRLAGKGEV